MPEGWKTRNLRMRVCRLVFGLKRGEEEFSEQTCQIDSAVVLRLRRKVQKFGSGARAWRWRRSVREGGLCADWQIVQRRKISKLGACDVWFVWFELCDVHHQGSERCSEARGTWARVLSRYTIWPLISGFRFKTKGSERQHQKRFLERTSLKAKRARGQSLGCRFS